MYFYSIVMKYMQSFLKHYFATLVFIYIVLLFLSVDIFFFIFVIIPVSLVLNFIFTTIYFALNKLLKLEFFIAILVVAIIILIDIQSKLGGYIEYADKVDFDNAPPQDQYAYYMAKNAWKLLSLLFVSIVHSLYCIFFGKNTFYLK